MMKRLLVALLLLSWPPTSPAGPQTEARSASEGTGTPRWRFGLQTTARIDRALEAVWKAKGVRPVERAGDAEFFRRVSLDLTGRIPAAADVRAFLADTRPDKRRLWVEKLLAGPGYVRHTTSVWRDELLPPSNEAGVPAWTAELEDWLRRQVRANVPYDRMARELLTTSLTFDPTMPNGRPDRPGEASPRRHDTARSLRVPRGRHFRSGCTGLGGKSERNFIIPYRHHLT